MIYRILAYDLTLTKLLFTFISFIEKDIMVMVLA